MKRFVAKEDVEKGLVDPTKPLHEQPQYQKKLEVQSKLKQTKQEPPKHDKPQKKDKPVAEGNHQQKQKKQRRQRQDRPQFNWNKKQITLETKLPQAPKKVLSKPDSEKFKAELTKLRQSKDTLYQQKQKLIDEQRFLIKSNSENKKTGFNALSKYGLELRQKNNLKKSLFEKINGLDQKIKHIEGQLQVLKNQNTTLRGPKDLQFMSSEHLKDRIANLQQRLSSANLDKKQQAQINNNINLAKRALLKARADIEIKTQISKNDDKIKIFYDELKILRKQTDGYYKELKPLKTQIDELQKKRKQQEGVITEVRSIEDIKADYDKKIKDIDAKREDAQKKMDQLKVKYNKQLDLYEDQQDLLRYIKYVQEEIDYKRKRKQEDQKRQKQKEQKELKQKKQFQERQKKRQQRKKQDQQRKQRDEQRKQKLQSERQTFINRNPNWQSIQLCQFMIKYCQNIRPQSSENKPAEQKLVKTDDLNLGKQKGWQKQAKSGCQVILGKKTKNDEEAPKKIKKEKKPRVEDANESINHSIDSINRFHQLSVLPPLNASQIDQTIKQLQDKIEILNKPSEQAIEAFKVKAAKQFDRLHGFHEDDEKEQEDEQKQVRHEKKKQRAEKVELKGADFPELN